MCPVRQHNKDKPDEHHIDFCMLSDSKCCFACHMDVCQEKNNHNEWVDKVVTELLTTQKAGINAIRKTGLDMVAPEGHRCLASDNKCICNELLAIMRDECRAFGGGTKRRKRKGFDCEQLNMTKATGERAECKLTCDPKNETINGQWRDDKGGGGGFARKANFQKWHKKSFFAVVYCMLLNSLIAWNLSCSQQTRTQRRKLQRHKFCHRIAEAMLNWSDPQLKIRSPGKRFTNQ